MNLSITICDFTDILTEIRKKQNEESKKRGGGQDREREGREKKSKR